MKNALIINAHQRWENFAEGKLNQSFASVAEDRFANSTSKCDTRLCRLTVLFEYLDRLPESETFPRS